MERIMLIINAVDLKEHSLDFACYLAKLTDSVLTGLFLENLPEDEQLVVTSVYEGTYIEVKVDTESPRFIAKNKIINENIARFTEFCRRKAVRSEICRDDRAPVHEVLKESRFADLLIVEADATFRRVLESKPSAFVRRILRNVACPVIVVPQNFQGIEEVIFAYDASSSSMFAIRQFTYLFPQLSSRKLVVINASEKEEAEIMLPVRLEEWLQAHYTSYVFEELHGKRLEILLDFIEARKNAILVMGSYGRRRVSRLIRDRMADVLVRKISAPVFIAHQ